MYQGYIKLWRKLQDNNLWTHEKFTRGQAWVDLILLANHKPKKIMIRGIEIFVDRGQLAYSELTLSKRWKWSRNKTRRFLNYLSQKTIQQIKQETNNITSIITILNYESYQGEPQQTEHQAEHQKDTKRYTNNNDKNDKNISDFKFSKKTPLPANIFLTDKMIEYATAQGCGNNGHVRSMFEDFCNHHAKVGSKFNDWTRAFYTWVRNDKKFYSPDKYKKILTGDEAIYYEGS